LRSALVILLWSGCHEFRRTWSRQAPGTGLFDVYPCEVTRRCFKNSVNYRLSCVIGSLWIRSSRMPHSLARALRMGARQIDPHQSEVG
jgi:hypothetical protein